MDAADRLERRKTLKERLGLKGMSCCGATWGFGPSAVRVRYNDDDDDEEEGPLQEQQSEVLDLGQTQPANGCVGQAPAAAAGMNLAAALAAERHYRAAQDSDGSVSPVGRTNNWHGGVTTAGTAPGTPLRMSLMRLLEETDGWDRERETSTAEMEERGGGGGVGSDSVCCVCMGRKKGAAFIPCGHTFCRVCSRELWLNRGSCPLCNRSILEILDIF